MAFPCEPFSILRRKFIWYSQISCPQRFCRKSHECLLQLVQLLMVVKKTWFFNLLERNAVQPIRKALGVVQQRSCCVHSRDFATVHTLCDLIFNLKPVSCPRLHYPLLKRSLLGLVVYLNRTAIKVWPSVFFSNRQKPRVDFVCRLLNLCVQATAVRLWPCNQNFGALIQQRRNSRTTPTLSPEGSLSWWLTELDIGV